MTGHERLLRDLTVLLQLAEAHEFHDHKNQLFGTPKVELWTRLQRIAASVKAGHYDNAPGEDG